LGTAIAAIIPIIVTVIRSSINENPALSAGVCIGFLQLVLTAIIQLVSKTCPCLSRGIEMAMAQLLITSSMPTQTSLIQDKNAEKP
jgi:hypothetical protein